MKQRYFSGRRPAQTSLTRLLLTCTTALFSGAVIALATGCGVVPEKDPAIGSARAKLAQPLSHPWVVPAPVAQLARRCQLLLGCAAA
jgi:hypothetical protein